MKSLIRALDRLSLARFAGGAFGIVAALLVLATPGWLFERLVTITGLSVFIAVAGPTPGVAARIIAVIVAAILAAGAVWSLVTAIGAVARKIQQGRPEYEDGEGAAFPVEPAGPEASGNVRRPIFAGSDLGAPFMSDEAIARIEGELLLETLAPEEEPVFPIPADDTSRQSIPALLDRLEAALERRRDRSDPVRPGDLASLHAALGESIRYH